MADETKVVNLPFSTPDLVGNYNTAYVPTDREVSPTEDYHAIFNSLISKDTPQPGTGFAVVPTKDIPMTGRYPLFFPGRDNEEIYAQAQGGWEKAYNGVVKMAGTATSTFINGTAGLLYGAMQASSTGKFNSFYNNPLTNKLNDWTAGLEDTYAHYKTLRERNGSWWEPENLFTGNFLWDNIVKNLGFSLGAAASGFAWGGALKAIGLTGKLMSTGVDMASKADVAISEAAVLPQAQRLGAVTSRLEGLWNGTQSLIGKGLIKADRAIVAGFGTVGEAGIESLNNSQEFRRKMIENYTAEHGYAPTGDAMKEINKYAENVGNWSFGANSALLSMTNYVQLPKIYSSSFKAEKEILNNIAYREGKYIATLPEKGFGKFLYKAKNIGSLFFNTAEGFEEGAQYAIQTGTQHYYGKKSKGEATDTFEDGIFYGIKEALTTDEGTLNIFTGAFSGALQSSGFVGVRGGLPTIGRTGKIGERGFTGYGGEEAVTREQALKALNESMIKDKMKDAYTNLKAAQIIQEEREAAIRRGDVLESKDLEFDYAHNFVATRLKYNAKEAIDTEIADLKREAVTPDGFTRLKQEGYAADTDTVASFITRLDNLQKHADAAKSLQDSLNLKYKGQINEDGGRVYSDDIISKLVYAGSKVTNYDDRIPQVNKSLFDAGITTTTEILQDILVNGIPKEEAVKQAIADIDGNAALTNDQKKDLKQDLHDLIELGMRRKNFIDEYNDILKNPKKYEPIEPITQAPPVPGEPVKTIKVTTKRGEQDLEIGTRYFLGTGVDYDEEGLETYIPISELTIEAEDEDGSIQIRTSEGEVRKVSKDVLAGYMLGKVDDLKKNVNANFFYHNRNKKYEYNFGKDYLGKRPGRLQYENGQLFFVFKNAKGQLQRRAISNLDFVAQKDFKNPRIIELGVIKDKTPEQKAADAAFKAEEALEEQRQTLARTREKRLVILREIEQETIDRLQEIKKDILDKQEDLKKTQKEIEEIQTKIDKQAKKVKDVEASKVIKTLKKGLDDLITTKAGIEDEIDKLTKEQSDLEMDLTYFQDFSQNAGELPEDTGDFLEELNNQIKWLEDLRDSTQRSIDDLKEMAKEVADAIKSVISSLQSAMKAVNPEISPEIQSTLNALLAGENIMANIGVLRSQLADFALSQDLREKIDLNEEKLADIQERLRHLNTWFDEIDTEYRAKKAITNRFQKIYEDYKRQAAEEKWFETNEEVIRKALGTSYNGVQILEEDEKKPYEPDSMKPIELVFRATMGILGTKAHQIRANKFGAKLNFFSNRDDIRAVYITYKNEKDLIPGLIDHLRKNDEGNIDESIERKEIIALVMVDKNGKLVGVDGKPLEEGANLLESAIYQVFPGPELKWSKQYGEKSMIRTDDENVRTAIIEQYRAWRDEVLANASVKDLHTIEASFGRVEEVKDSTGKTDQKARISVEDAGLIEEADLNKRKLISIPKTNKNHGKGSVMFSSPFGRVFLELKNGLAKLRNRRLTNTEAETIYKAMHQLSKEMVKEKDGISNTKSKVLLKYLKSIIYWGIPEDVNKNKKETGYNSIFWMKDEDTGKFVLSMSGKGKTFPFTPKGLEQNRLEIIGMLRQMYNNVNSYMANDTNETYQEIMDITPEGEIVDRIWENYQTYLLSNKTPDGKPRTGEELPLATVVRPLNNEDDVNRKNIYFYTTDNADQFTIPVAEKKVVSGRVLTPGTPRATATPSAPATVGEKKTFPDFKLDGTSNNVLAGKEMKLGFRAPADTTVDNYMDKILILNNNDFAKIKKKFEDEGKDAKAEMKKSVWLAIKGQIARMKSEEAEFELEATIGDEYFGDIQAEVEAQTGAPLAPKTQEFIQSVDDKVNNALETGFEDFDMEIEIQRLVTDEVNRFEGENWKKVEAWLKANFPNVPIYRVKNILKATNGRLAYGMFKNGAVYVYENAEIGTAYHEVFHAIWRMATDSQERKNIINELRNREGTFFDRELQRDVKYSDPEVTDIQLEDVIAEEFRDYVQFKKIPAKPKDGRSFIERLFSSLVQVIKEFFMGPQAQSLTEELFKNINEGQYKDFVPYSKELSYAQKGIIDIEDAKGDADTAFSLIGINDRQRSDIIQHMTFATLRDMVKNHKSLFTPPSFTGGELYGMLKAEILETIGKKIVVAKAMAKSGSITDEESLPIITNTELLMQYVELQWDQIIEAHKEYLRSHNIQFTEEDEGQFTDENRTKGSDFQEATKIDSFKRAHSAIKLLLSTIPVLNEKGKPRLSSIGGITLLPVKQTFVSVMNNVHDAMGMEDMLLKLKEMATMDAHYRVLYTRITNRDYADEGIDLEGLTETHSMQLLGEFWKTFKKQNPEVKNVFILENGQVVVGDASLSSAATQIRSEYESTIKEKINNGTSYIKWDSTKKKYVSDVTTLKQTPLKTLTDMVNFLKHVGITFTVPELQRAFKDSSKYTVFKDAVAGIKKSLAESEEVSTINSKILSVHGRLLELALLKAYIDNPQFDSTYFNVSGERTQSFIGINAASELRNFLSQTTKFTKAAISDSQYAYLKTDSFSQNSNLLKRMFAEDGDPREGEENKDLTKVGYVGGSINQRNGKTKPSSKLSFMERIIQEINLNLTGWYLNLVPGDASMEWMIKMGNAISIDSLNRGMSDVFEIFKGYLIDEINLSREDRPIAKVKGRNPKDLRFFKDIFDIDETGRKLREDISNSKESAEDTYKTFEKRINAAVERYINRETQKFERNLTNYGILTVTKQGYSLENINVPQGMKEEEMRMRLKTLTVNYMIANIELHKVLYSDPYQYSDELKRIKNFLSPRQALINNSPSMRVALNNVWNKWYGKKDIAYTNFTRDYFRSVTHADVPGVIDLFEYEQFKETDGSGIIIYKAYRQFRILAGDWYDAEESQYKYDMAWEKREKSKGLTERQIKGRGLTLSDEELAILEKGNPEIKSAYTPVKPIVAGNKANGRDYNDVLLDKFALYPLSYRLMSDLNKNGNQATSNALSLYNKMQKEDIDYMVFESGRKVGAEEVHESYDEKGNFNNEPYKGIINVPFAIMSVQAEVPSKDVYEVTRGSQMTKLVTMDFMEAGVPVDFYPNKDITTRYKAWNSLDLNQKLERSPIYREIVNNEKLLQALTEEGYKRLLQRLGIIENIVDKKKAFTVKNFDKAVTTLREEVLKREVNDNISAALTAFLEGKSVLEATPAYQQIRNILYSIADKEVISPKMPGGMKVQIPSTFIEEKRKELKIINDEKGYVSEALNFYSEVKDDETGKRIKVNVCELMVGRWFDSDMSDKELLRYLNDTDEGQKILSGVAYRIPTQKQNSIDVFKIKRFLPKEFGDSVVIPAALVQKAGSDFDIDKLTIYLKNVFRDSKGNPRLVPYFGIGKAARDKFLDMYDKGELLSKEENDRIQELIVQYKEEQEGLTEREAMRTEALSSRLMALILGEEYDQALLEEYLANTTSDQLRDRIVDSFYKKSLENAYIESGENLVKDPSNYDRLIKPNSADQLKKLAKEIALKTVGKEFDYTAVGNMLDRGYMSSLRHAFVSGKYAIGIAAVNQTNHSLNQRQPIYIDPSKLDNMSDDDKFWLGDGLLKFEKFNKININGRMLATLSMIRNAEKNEKYPNGQDISEIIAQFIDGYVDISKGPWIMQLGATPNVASTFLFLVKAGVPVDTVAYFMNQPIVRDYLRSVETAGYSWLFMESFMENIQKNPKYAVENAKEKVRGIESLPSQSELRENLEKEEFNEQEKLQQQFILQEFLKYAKMAEHLFYITQGTNFDTANFNDPYLVFKKFEQLKKAQNSIIGPVDELLKNSFVGNLGETIKDVRDALATILKSDQKTVRTVIQKVLLPFIDLPDRDFVKLAQKAVNDLFDWAVQTNQTDENGVPFNKLIKEVLVEKSGVAAEVMAFIRQVKANPRHSLYNNHIINIIEGKTSETGELGTNNLKIKGQDNTVYEQNNIIYAFRELRDNPIVQANGMYEKIKLLAVIQSGLTTSPISFTSVLPYEDFEGIYNEVLAKLETIPNLGNFYDLGVFQRNNWNNDDIVPWKKAITITEKKSGRKVYNPAMAYLDPIVKAAVASAKIPPVMTQIVNDREANSDYIVYTWEKENDLLTETEIQAAIAQRRDLKSVVWEKKAAMRKAGDFSYIQKGLFKKVTDAYGTPLTKPYKDTTYYVYKAINAWGDSFRGNEFYTTDHQSVLQNGFVKVSDVSNDVIIDLFLGKAVQPVEIVDRYTDADVKANRGKIFVFGDNLERVGKGGQAQIRDNRNAMGIVTKMKPATTADAYMSDATLERNKRLINSDISAIKKTNKPVVFPKDGLGTGLAQLKTRAPKTYAFLKERLLEEFGFDNDTGELIDSILPEAPTSETTDWEKEDNNCPIPF